MITQEVKTNIGRTLSIFENDSGSPETDYYSLYLYFDGPNNTKQTTLSRGFTESGTLWDVFQKYESLGGKYGAQLLSYRNQKGKQTLPYNKEFLNLIVKASKEDQLMRDAQDSVFDEKYFKPALAWFNKGKFTEALSLAVVVDSYLHSGLILPFLINRFSEKKPIDGGDEKAWILAYVNARYNWLKNHSNKILNGTVYRCAFFQKQIKDKNWNFNCPMIANGRKVCK